MSVCQCQYVSMSIWQNATFELTHENKSCSEHLNITGSQLLSDIQTFFFGVSHFCSFKNCISLEQWACLFSNKKNNVFTDGIGV